MGFICSVFHFDLSQWVQNSGRKRGVPFIWVTSTFPKFVKCKGSFSNKVFEILMRYADEVQTHIFLPTPAELFLTQKNMS